MRSLILLVGCLVAAPALADGKALYDALCSTCHGVAGMGDGPGVPEEMIRPRPFSAGVFKFDTDSDWRKGTDADLANVIRNGTRAYGGSPLMPPWPGLDESQLAALVAHIRALQRATPAP